MALVFYNSDDFPQDSVLVKESLYETIYRLEEAYWGLRELTLEEAYKTFTWILTRITENGRLMRTAYDRTHTGGYKNNETGAYVRIKYPKSLTGEPGWKSAYVLLCSVLRMPDQVPELTQGLRDNFILRDPGPLGSRFGPGSESIIDRGMYCCPVCTPQYERALQKAAPELYQEQEPKFVNHLREWRERGGGTRWYRAPFYLTVLALHDIGSEATQEELRMVAQRVKPQTFSRWTGPDRTAQAKAIAAAILKTYR